MGIRKPSISGRQSRKSGRAAHQGPRRAHIVAFRATSIVEYRPRSAGEPPAEVDLPSFGFNPVEEVQAMSVT